MISPLPSQARSRSLPRADVCFTLDFYADGAGGGTTVEFTPGAGATSYLPPFLHEPIEFEVEQTPMLLAKVTEALRHMTVVDADAAEGATSDAAPAGATTTAPMETVAAYDGAAFPDAAPSMRTADTPRCDTPPIGTAVARTAAASRRSLAAAVSDGAIGAASETRSRSSRSRPLTQLLAAEAATAAAAPCEAPLGDISRNLALRDLAAAPGAATAEAAGEMDGDVAMGGTELAIAHSPVELADSGFMPPRLRSPRAAAAEVPAAAIMASGAAQTRASRRGGGTRARRSVGHAVSPEGLIFAASPTPIQRTRRGGRGRGAAAAATATAAPLTAIASAERAAEAWTPDAEGGDAGESSRNWLASRALAPRSPFFVGGAAVPAMGKGVADAGAGSGAVAMASVDGEGM